MAGPAGAGASDTADGRQLPGTRRTEAFSDGVFAIVITLLVLDLVNPDYRTGDLAAALLGAWPAYLAFVVSFVYVGVIWLNHHALFRHVDRMSPAFSWINLGVLLGAVIIPFPTVVVASAFAAGSGGDERAAVVLYACAAALMSGSWLAAFGYLARHPGLLAAGTAAGYGRRQLARPVTGIGLYAVSGLVGWLASPVAGLVLIVVMIVYHAVTSEGLYEGPLGRLIARPGDRDD
ncbi:MAG TPA: TMEM175 family protein [Streptosporangiaceae bacterium]|nr:TMEM175 family protein [Streptosporangiaceae bacterium]